MSLRKILLPLFLVLVTACFCQNSQKNLISQFRGPDRNGIYPDNNLLKKWPVKGPEMIWSFEGLGSGHGNVSFAKDKIFILGMPDTLGVLYAFNHSGKLIWKKTYGPEWYINYPGTRTTPTIIDNLLYFESGRGVVYCYDTDGNQKWTVDLLNKFDAKNVEWGKAESLLISGDTLYCTPGGVKNNIVSLNRFTGETIWTSPGNSEPPAYTSPVLVRYKKSSLLLTLTSESIVCLDAKTGKFYWQVPQAMEYKNNANSLVFDGKRIYCLSDMEKPNSGLVALSLSDDGRKFNIDWRNTSVSGFMGGFIVRDGFIYAPNSNKKLWFCVDANSGKVQYITKALTTGCVIQGNGQLYCYCENGTVALVDATPSSFNVVSSFKITKGTDQHWAHPVIHNGLLFIRHGNALMVYNIKQN